MTVARESHTHTYPTSTAPPFAIEAQHLVKRYKDKTAVDSLSLQVRAGETLGLLGTNGAGKTTTAEILSDLRRPTEGSVRVLGLCVPRPGEAPSGARCAATPGEPARCPHRS